MKKIILATFLIFINLVFSYGQGTLRGKITDDKGETLIGVTVVLKSNKAIGISTDFDGNYSLKLPDASSQVIVISYISYKTIEETVQISNGQILVKNFVMTSSAQALGEVQIVAKAVRAKDYYIEQIKKNSATSIDYISSETMKKTGDNNVTAAVARVAGVSTNGGFITVRGIGDRYVKTGINGSRIPTLDPFTNNIKLDLFPASLVDNIIITKTASPDLPGDWAGAYLSVETKDYPDQLEVNVETSVGYNNQSTLKEIISSQRSKTDWLGYDKNFRDHDQNSFAAPSIRPTQYQELVALGLGDYYKSLGVTQQNWGEGTTTGETYYKLGLIQLGLLAPALINDNVAISNAKSIYENGNYKSDAFQLVNAGVPKSGQSFPSNWNTTTRQAPLNFSQSFSIGNQTTFFGKPLGFIVGFRYSSSNVYDDNSTANRASVVGGTGPDSGTYISSVSSRLTQKNSAETNGWNALVNLSYKLNTNNNISLLFMPNFSGVNKVRKSIDQTDKQVVATLSQFYEQRKQLVYQLKSENYIPKYKTKIEANISYTNGNSTAPDFKNVQYWINPDGTFQIGGAIGDGIHRYYRYLKDNIFDSRISAEFALSNKPGLSRKLKIGGAYQSNDRKYDQYDYAVDFGGNPTPLLNEDINGYLNLDKFGINTSIGSNGVPISSIAAFYNDFSNAADHTFGKSEISAGFIMIDYAISFPLRITGGVRIESSKLFTDVVEFDSLGLAENDPRRIYDTANPLANPGKLNEVDILPSINIIYKLKQDELAPVNLRLNFSQTLARPSLRELSDVSALDYELRARVYGNSNLKTVHINNYDARLEWYFKSNDNISVSLFYKNFKNHIELVNSAGFTWQNVDKSYTQGIEIEGKKNITKSLEFAANITLVNSKTSFVRKRVDTANGIKTYIPIDTISRTMFGQAPYAINGILSYSLDSIRLNVTISYNVQGPRLVISSDKKEEPDVYEMPRNLLDLKVAKKLGKHFGVSFTIKDILNAPVRRSYKYGSDFNVLDYDKFTYGTNYIFSVSYKL